MASASMKLLQDHLAAKRRSLAQQQAKLQAQKELQAKKAKHSNQIIIESELHKQENEWSLEEEYDPLVPNSYEVLRAEYIKTAEKQRLALLSGNKTGQNKINFPDILNVLDRLDGSDDESSPVIKKVRGTAIAPPPTLNTSSTSVPEQPSPVLIKGPSNTDVGQSRTDNTSVAAKIMSKMGYKAGQGLGKDEQGISSPLEIEKNGQNLGRIIEPKEGPKVAPEEPNLKGSTRVLLLQNMVGPGEVDDDLEAETKEECKKYGDVVKCLIFEIPNKKVPDDEAVRIFVEFKQVESAAKAVSDLDGRYFGGRVVRASFYNVERFNKYDLGPTSAVT